MHLLLTHEQADFDAIASLLAAYLLNERAIPVLPRRINRNVRAFISLYEEELPFVEMRDLPSEPVEKITLLDTQSLISVKGFSARTQVRVIDHHPLRENLPGDWQVTIADTGSTTAILTEELREVNGNMSVIQATLLLLGIYEDTGTLTYSRTTPQDLRASAFLIEQGASLQIATNFINHPLSPAQQQLYEDLYSKARFLQVQGHSVVITCGDALEIEEELSTVAHKLGDLFDPDALFLLVTTRSGIQLIARSTTDNIDVSAIVAHFGGGGHERAAAGLIRERNLQDVCRELEEMLPRFVKPAVTVAQMMSRNPQLLSPDTLVEEAAQQMRRYGHEGYPVIHQGKVVGLLTRREVDRALSHQMNCPVSKIMKKGSFTVHPEDSVEHLQRLVIQTDWGQVPVVDSQTGEIIGIVTRTDLIKTLSPQPKLPGRMNLADKLESALPADRLKLLKIIAEAAYLKHAALYIVGGFVRDLILECPSLDFDLVVEGDAISLARYLAQKHGGRVTGHVRFGTAKWHLSDSTSARVKPNLMIEGLRTVDLVSARTEFYTYPSALPTVERGSIKLDLHRRDFTMNTLALRLDGRHYGELHDYWGGLADLRAGVVRVLHSLSFIDDPTRILRAARFEKRFSFTIESRTMELLLEARPLISKLSGERIRHELDNILNTPEAPKILHRLAELDLLSVIHPSLVWDDWLAGKFSTLAQIGFSKDWNLPRNMDEMSIKRSLFYTLWSIRLPLENAIQLSRRLKMPAALIKVVHAACAMWHERNALREVVTSAFVSRLENVPELAQFALYIATDDSCLRERLYTYATCWRTLTPTVDGNFLKARGLSPGPVYREILTTLRNAWLDGIVSTPEEECLMLDSLLHQARFSDGQT